MTIDIRAAKENDFEDILLLIKEFSVFQKMPEKMTNNLGLMLEEKEHFNCFVAEDEDKQIVGYATYFFAYYTWIGKCLYMDDLYVKESHRGKGIGTKLTNSIFDFAKTEKCKKVRWQVSKWNSPAIEFYRSLGATVDDIELNCDLLLNKSRL